MISFTEVTPATQPLYPSPHDQTEVPMPPPPPIGFEGQSKYIPLHLNSQDHRVHCIYITTPPVGFEGQSKYISPTP